MITTNGGYKKLEAGDYVSAALSDENSAFNQNVGRMETELAGKLSKNGGNLSGILRLGEGSGIALKNGANEYNGLFMDGNGNVDLCGTEAVKVPGDIRLNASGGVYVSGSRVWTAKNLTVSAAAPANPAEGDIWIDIS